MDLSAAHPSLLIVVGSGGVGKTTLAASMGLVSARAGHDTLVMTFDPSLRLKDALGVGEAAREEEIEVPADTPGRLAASLLDARRTFDRLVARYAPDDDAKERILSNPYYHHLSGHLGGILEYMAVERLYEVAREGRYQRIILDTPPTRQALDFLEAPQRIVQFLDSGALKLALRDWFDDSGRLRSTRRIPGLGRGLEALLDRVVGLKLLRDMSEFFLAFGPLFAGFRERATAVESLLKETGNRFVLVSGPGEERIPDTLFFARRLHEAGLSLGPLVVNRVHPEFPRPSADAEHPSEAQTSGQQLFHWLGERHRQGLQRLRQLVGQKQALISLPLQPEGPTDLASLEALGESLQHRLQAESERIEKQA